MIIEDERAERRRAEYWFHMEKRVRAAIAKDVTALVPLRIEVEEEEVRSYDWRAPTSMMPIEEPVAIPVAARHRRKKAS